MNIMKLNYIEYPASQDEFQTPMLICHGLFGSAKNWNSHARKLAIHRKIFCVDMRNHGDSDWDDDQSYKAMANDLAAFISDHMEGSAIVLGHSMGGKAAMMLALNHPDKVKKLIVADIAPVAYAHSHGGFIDAMQAVDLNQISRRSEADPLLVAAIPVAPLRSFILQNLQISDNQASWRINLEALQNGMEDMVGFPHVNNSYDAPSLFIYGTASDYITDDIKPVISELFPTNTLCPIIGAGHWLHHEKPAEFLKIISDWLSA